VTEAVAKFVGKLPGGGKLEEWVRNGRSNSWRKQQEQLQRDKYDIHQVCVCVDFFSIFQFLS
jgi:hypothetical protein